MLNEEAHPEAAAILRDAGWTPHPEWGVYTRGTLVMGGIAGSFHVKDYARIPPGHPLHSADTPDEPHEAAAWLVARFTPAVDLGFDLGGGGFGEAGEGAEYHIEDDFILAAQRGASALALQSEEGENLGHESNGETGEAFERRAEDLGRDASAGTDGAEEQAAEPEFTVDESGSEPEAQEVSSDPIDADFTIEDLGSEDLLTDDDFELPAIEGADLPEEEAPEPAAPEPPQDRFYGLDDLDRRRSLRIGDVIRYANGLMPRWLPEDDARLATLRNFAMGVSEKRWDDNPANQAELNALETTIRRINEIKNARDDKVAFLEGASREEIEDFAVERDWP